MILLIEKAKNIILILFIYLYTYYIFLIKAIFLINVQFEVQQF